MRLRVGVVSTLLSAFVLLGGGGEGVVEAASVSKAIGRIAYTGVLPDFDLEIFVMNTDGSGKRNVTRQRSDDREPSWSSDGSKIAFVSGVLLRAGIYVMNADGSGRRSLPLGPGHDFEPIWSPRGRRIAFTSNRDRRYQVYAMNTDGSGQKNLSKSTFSDWQPAWSPDGRHIAFAGQGLPNNEGDLKSGIFVMNADGSEAQWVPGTTVNDLFPVWSPEGSKIAFVRKLGGSRFAIYVIGIDGTGLRRLAGNAGGFRISWHS